MNIVLYCKKSQCYFLNIHWCDLITGEGIERLSIFASIFSSRLHAIIRNKLCDPVGLFVRQKISYYGLCMIFLLALYLTRVVGVKTESLSIYHLSIDV